MKQPLTCAFVFQILGLLALPSVAPDEAKTQSNAKRLRVIMTTDFPPIGVVKGGNVPNDQKSDPDDMQSMVRFLLDANEFDIEALIASSGTFANKVQKTTHSGCDRPLRKSLRQPTNARSFVSYA